MSWLKKLVGREGEEPKEPAGHVDAKPQESGNFPTTITIVPDELTVTVYLHDLETKTGPIPCWTYVSDGMMAHRQKELVLTLQRLQGEDPSALPSDPMGFFKLVFQLAKQGQRVDVGSVTELSSGTVLGECGFAYALPNPLPGVVVPGAGLALIVLKDREIDIAKRYGVSRVLAQLGSMYRHYPYPTWFDRSRQSLPVAAIMEGSFLKNFPHMDLSGAYAVKRDGIVALRLTRAAGDQLLNGIRDLNDDRLFALNTGHSATSDSSLVWLPGQQLNAIGPDGSEIKRLEGNFVAVVAVEEENRASIVEDGFVVRLNETTWAEVKGALQNMEPLRVPATTDGFDFAIEWLAVGYRNPLDGIVYESAKGWENFSPDSAANEVEPPDQVARLLSIIVLTPESQLEAGVNTGALNEFITQIERVVLAHFQELPETPGLDFLLQVTLAPNRKTERLEGIAPKLGEMEMGSIAMDVLDSQIADLEEPEVVDVIRFQMLFQLNGGDQDGAFSKCWL